MNNLVEKIHVETLKMSFESDEKYTNLNQIENFSLTPLNMRDTLENHQRRILKFYLFEPQETTRFIKGVAILLNSIYLILKLLFKY